MLMERIRDYFTHVAVEPEQEDADRRRARRKSVFLRATVYPVNVFCDARIRDISATGVKGEAEVELAIGQTLHVTIDEKTYHAGTVKWTRDRHFGLDLPNAFSILCTPLAEVDHGSLEGHKPRASRTKVDTTARLVGGHPPRPAMVRNLSATGLLLDTSPGIKPGQHMVVRVGNAPPIYGRAQWSNSGKIGFKAEHPISVLMIACAADEQ